MAAAREKNYLPPFIMQLIIGNKNYSSWSLRPWLLLRHFNIEFDEIRIPLFTDEFETTLKKYTDAGKVPVLIDDKTTVWDSLAICEYISEQYLQGKGYPLDTAARAECRSASAEMHSSFFQLREHMPMNCRAQRSITITEDMAVEIQRIDQLWQNLRSKYQQQGEWLFGEFSIADCMYAPMASRFHSYQPELSAVSRDYISSLMRHPQLKIWYQQSAAETEVITQSEVGQP